MRAVYWCEARRCKRSRILCHFFPRHFIIGIHNYSHLHYYTGSPIHNQYNYSTHNDHLNVEANVISATGLAYSLHPRAEMENGRSCNAV